ncbi:MAG: phytanoyl-CoA dioxygenase family protein [Ilumatobacteraceae bacterium]
MHTAPATTEHPDMARLVADYERDGAVCARHVVDAALVQRVAAAIDANLAAPGPLALIASRDDDPGKYATDFCNWHRFEAYMELARTAAPIAQALMRSQSVRLYHDHLLVKEAGTRQRTPWHQDQPYYDVEGRQVVSMWFPVDPVPRESTLEFVAGTHHGQWLMPRSFMVQEAKWFPEGSLEEVPDVEANRDAYPIIGWALAPGDAVFFQALALHGSNGSAERRRVISIRYLGDDARRVERPWRCSPPIPADATFPVLIEAGGGI